MLRQADQARADFADIFGDLDFIKSHLARLALLAALATVALVVTGDRGAVPMIDREVNGGS